MSLSIKIVTYRPKHASVYKSASQSPVLYITGSTPCSVYVIDRIFVPTLLSGSFLIPYLIMLTFCGIPLFMTELGLGQFSGYGAMTSWRSSPIFKGMKILERRVVKIFQSFIKPLSWRRIFLRVCCCYVFLNFFVNVLPVNVLFLKRRHQFNCFLDNCFNFWCCYEVFWISTCHWTFEELFDAER